MTQPNGQFNNRTDGEAALVAAIAERLRHVRERIDRSASRAGRDPASILLVAVSKTHPGETVRAAMAAGLDCFGENRVQEAVAKIDQVGVGAHWQLIGHLQRNKAAAAVGRFDLIHAVDSVSLIEELEKKTAAREIVQRILLQLNVSGEGSKSGAPPEDLPRLIEALESTPHLAAEGLMTMPPWDPDPEVARPHFVRLRQLLATTQPTDRFSPLHLSMGMSHDFEVAIAEGATAVRIGTALLGERAKKERGSGSEESET